MYPAIHFTCPDTKGKNFVLLKGVKKMRTIKLIDMTLRETGAIRDNTLSFKEKLEIARILDRLKADVIELPPLSGSKADQLSNKTIASAVKTGLSAAIEIAGGNVAETWESIKNAAHPQLNLEAPVSTVQMEYVCHKKAPAMLESCFRMN